MATGISGAGRLRDDVDYLLPHRPAPAIPTVAYTSTSPNRAPEIGDRPFQSPRSEYEAELLRAKNRGHERGANGSYSNSERAESRARKNSFGGLLRRSSSHTHPDHPPLPALATHHPDTRATNAQAQPTSPSTPEKSPTYFNFGQTATITSAVTSPGRDNTTTYGDGVSGHERFGIFRTKSRDSNKSKRQPNMLRKSSRARQQQQAELERQAREAQLLPKQPPRLPSHNPLPGIATFDDQESPRDSVAIFNQHAYTSPRSPPTVPAQAPHPGPPLPQAANFSRPGNVNMPSQKDNSSSPAYAIRGASASVSPPPVPNGDHYDSIGERSSSMTNRGRYSYASTTANPAHVNSPRRVRRRKDPTPFNVLVIGTKNSGKSSFINFLRHSLALPALKQQEAETQTQQTKGTFTSSFVESEMDGERIGLTLWDSVGLDKNVVDLQLRDMTNFIEAKFEDTFTEEQKVSRSPGFKDTHIHCVFLVLDPVRLDATVAALANSKGGPVRGSNGALDDEVDMQVLRALWGKTTVIPVISKADTVTIGHMTHLKRSVWQSIKDSDMNPLEALELEDDDEEDEDESSNPTGSVIDNLLDRSDSESESSDSAIAPKLNKRASHARNISLSAAAAAATADEEPYLPMSVLSPDPYDLPPYTSKVPKAADLGRRFPWGTASPLNENHCDYIRLRDSVFSEWRPDLRELSRVKWYEQWRTSRLRNVPGSKQRLKGGVTPVGSVPRESRSESVRNFSAGPGGVPRSVSSQGHQPMPGATSVPQMPSVGMAVSTPGQQDGVRAAF